MSAVIANIHAFWNGFVVTCALSAISTLIALVAGVLLAALRISPVAVLRFAAAAYVEVARNTPLTVIFFFAVFVLPQLGLHASFFFFAVLSLVIYYAAFFCEAVRSGINAVSRGQVEAAKALGLRFGQILREIILPQALRTAVPPMVNVVIALIKNTAVASAFGVAESLAAMEAITNRESNHVIAILIATALLYLLATIPLGLLANVLEKRVRFVR